MKATGIYTIKALKNLFLYCSFLFFPAPAELIWPLNIAWLWFILRFHAAFHPQNPWTGCVAQMEHPGVAWWHLSDLGTCLGKGVPLEPKNINFGPQIVVFGNFFACLQCIHAILSCSLTASEGLTLWKHQLLDRNSCGIMFSVKGSLLGWWNQKV